MTREQAWEMEYRQRRYLERLSADELLQRQRDVFNNLMMLFEDGKIGPRSPFLGGAYWIRKSKHVQCEYLLRAQPRMPDVPGANLPRPTWPFRPRGWHKRFQPHAPLVRYGKAEHLTASLERGIIRVAPASSYNDPSLNAAQHDDELALTVYSPGADVGIGLLGPRGEITPLPPLGDVKVTYSFPRNYYVYCVACIYDLRLFNDFGADACLWIHDPSEFSRRLQVALERELPEFAFRRSAVSYVDPYDCDVGRVQLPFSKHFRYSYQFEYRFVHVPQTDNPTLAPLFVELGPLKDIAELVLTNEGGPTHQSGR